MAENCICNTSALSCCHRLPESSDYPFDHCRLSDIPTPKVEKKTPGIGTWLCHQPWLSWSYNSKVCVLREGIWDVESKGLEDRVSSCSRMKGTRAYIPCFPSPSFLPVGEPGTHLNLGISPSLWELQSEWPSTVESIKYGLFRNYSIHGLCWKPLACSYGTRHCSQHHHSHRPSDTQLLFSPNVCLPCPSTSIFYKLGQDFSCNPAI